MTCSVVCLQEAADLHLEEIFPEALVSRGRAGRRRVTRSSCITTNCTAGDTQPDGTTHTHTHILDVHTETNPLWTLQSQGHLRVHNRVKGKPMLLFQYLNLHSNFNKCFQAVCISTAVSICVLSCWIGQSSLSTWFSCLCKDVNFDIIQ